MGLNVYLMSELNRQLYFRLKDNAEDLYEAVSQVIEDRSYFDSADVAGYLGEDNTSEVGKMLEGLRKKDVLEVLNPESTSSNKFVSDKVDSEGFLRVIADFYRADGLGRSEAAEKLADLTGWSPATYNSRFTEWGLRFQGHPDELKEEIMAQVEGYDQRSLAMEELSDEYEQVSARTIDNWINDRGLYFDPTDEEREVVRYQMDFLNRKGFPRNHSREIVSYLEDVPESTINDWITGEVLFSED